MATAFLLLLLLQPADAAPPVTGRVEDPSGAGVTSATVTLTAAGGAAAETMTDPDGAFAFAGFPAGTYLLVVHAPGFVVERRTVSHTAAAASRLLIVLRPEPFTETVTVTASRSAAGFWATGASTSILTREELLESAAWTVDESLRGTPGFSLFRRSSSRVANPTTQGVTLRGVAGSGASRTLVLADGRPLNDPFGGWVYWNRIPRVAIDRVEVVRGGGSDLYGADALGGVIQVLSVRPTRPTARVLVEGGSHDTVRASALLGGRVGRMSGFAAVELMRTDGFFIVAGDERGPVDARSWSEYDTGVAGLGYQSTGFRLQGRVNVFSEDRGNGTPLQVNDTNLREGSIEAAGSTPAGDWSLQAYGASQGYDQIFSAIAADRASESLTRTQRVPSRATGISGQWVRQWSRAQLVAGGEGRAVEGTTNETGYVAGRPTGHLVAGGRQRTIAGFAQTTIELRPRVSLTLGGRGDTWRSEEEGTGASRTDAAFSPRGSISFSATDGLVIRASGYRAFRTPTLNELHRGFRVGNVLTMPNASLDPEHAVGAEGSVLVQQHWGSARVVGFWNRVSDPITNVTLSVTPSLITRQRRNAGRLRAGGVEVEAATATWRGVALSAALTIVDARFTAAPDPALQDNRVPQVPRYQSTISVRYNRERITAVGQYHATGVQFDDDRNELPLNPAHQMDLYGAIALRRGVEVFAAIDNVADEDYDVGRTPIRTVGAPRSIRVGFKWTGDR